MIEPNLDPDKNKIKKKHRRTKKQILEDKLNELNNITEPQEVTIKKRGRKPKGGKILKKDSNSDSIVNTSSNIILHLKCSLKDLNKPKTNDIEFFDFDHEEFHSCEKVQSNNILKLSHEEPLIHDSISESKNNSVFQKEIRKKLKQLEIDLHKNIQINNKSDCFWCTCSFDNSPIYIPKVYKNNKYNVYGCFCSPECATAFLMKENIDSSTKFERYQLLNNIYAKIYKYTNNIKPAPSPFYTLNKFQGNLSIQEYRSLFNNDRLYIVIDKPLTVTLPELHEDNDDYIINNKIIPSNNVILKNTKKDNKSDILNDKFYKTLSK